MSNSNSSINILMHQWGETNKWGRRTEIRDWVHLCLPNTPDSYFREAEWLLCEIDSGVPNGCQWDTSSQVLFKVQTPMWYLHVHVLICLNRVGFWGSEIRLLGSQNIHGVSVHLYCQKSFLSCLKLNPEVKREKNNWPQCTLKNTRVNHD